MLHNPPRYPKASLTRLERALRYLAFYMTEFQYGDTPIVRSRLQRISRWLHHSINPVDNMPGECRQMLNAAYELAVANKFSGALETIEKAECLDGWDANCIEIAVLKAHITAKINCSEPTWFEKYIGAP